MASHSASLWKRGLGNSEMAYLTQLVPRLTRIFKPTIYSNISFYESANLTSANANGAWGSWGGDRKQGAYVSSCLEKKESKSLVP